MKKMVWFFAVIFYTFSAVANIDMTLVVQAEKYLNSITSLQGNFTQTSNDAQQHKGTFSMLRPGKLRLDYLDLPVQLISDGSDLYFFDKALDQITTVPLTSTPAGILVRKKVDLQHADISILETDNQQTYFSVKLYLKKQKELGYMNILFEKKPVKIKSWVIVDAIGNKTEVVFDSLKTEVNFGKNYFQIQHHKIINTNNGDDFYD